jgi:hypothetical protein
MKASLILCTKSHDHISYLMSFIQRIHSRGGGGSFQNSVTILFLTLRGFHFLAESQSFITTIYRL